MFWFHHTCARRKAQGCGCPIQCRQDAQNLFCGFPQLRLILPDVRQIFRVYAPRFVGAPRKLVEIVAGAAQQRHHLPQLRQIELDYIAVNGDLAKIGAHVVRAELRHLCLDLVAFLRRHIEHQRNGAVALFHRASRSFFADADRSAARVGTPCSFSRTEAFCWLRTCSAAKSLRT